MNAIEKALPGQQTIGGNEVAGKSLDDIECEHLAGWMVRNGCKPPTITKTWRDAARRMREIDGRTHEQVLAAIDWCQRSEFWQANIHSMPTLREKYEVLRMQAKRERERRPARTARQSASDVRRLIATGQA